MVHIRQATREDADRVVDTMVAAFVTDPAWDFITGGDRERVDPLFARALFDSRVDAGTVWVTDDCTAAALWEFRDQDSTDIKTTLGEDPSARAWEAYRSAVGEQTWERLEVYEAELELRAPARPYWYLGVLATHPEHHNKGYASALLAHTFAIADAAHLPCWLETEQLDNLTFYWNRGFTERVEFDLPDGTRVWWVGRPHMGVS
jgi:GNAT superfamily N-acetyltransferase